MLSVRPWPPQEPTELPIDQLSTDQLSTIAAAWPYGPAPAPPPKPNYAYLDHAGMPTEEWTSDEADPYQLPDDPDNWRDESEE